MKLLNAILSNWARATLSVLAILFTIQLCVHVYQLARTRIVNSTSERICVNHREFVRVSGVFRSVGLPCQ